MRALPILSACAILLSLTSAAIAGDFYVDPVKGKDVPTAGSATKPWKTINYAIGQSTKLSTTAHIYHLSKGRFVESPSSASIPASYTATLSFVGNSPGNTVITGTFFWGPHNGIQIQSLSCAGLTMNTTVTQPALLDLRDCSMGPCSLNASSKGSYSIAIQTSRLQKLDVILGSFAKSIVRVQKTTIGSGGVRLQGSTGSAGSILEFEDCHFENARQDGLTAFLAKSTLTIRRCLIRNSGRHGIDLNSRYGVMNGNLVKILDTTILASGTSGIHVVHDPRSKKHLEHDLLQIERSVLSANAQGVDDTDWALTIQDSMIVQGKKTGIRCKTTLPDLAVQITRSSIADHGGSAVALEGFDKARFRMDNSILSSNADGISGKLAATSKGIDVESCTIADNKGSGYAATGLNASTLSIHHTIFGGNKVSLTLPTGSKVQYCLSDRQLLTGTGNLKGKPGFVNAAWGVYQLSPSSPAIDAGNASLIRAALDFEGDPRILRTKATTSIPDIGADEYSRLGVAHVAAAATTPIGMPLLRMSKMGRLRTGTMFSTTLEGPRISDATLWLLGLSERRLTPTLALPFDFGVFGFPGTMVHTNLTASFAGARSPNGDAVLAFPVPDDKTIVGLPVRLQALVLGREGLGSSRLLRATVGTIQADKENFINQAHLDPTLSGANWGGGKVLPGKLGGSGIHGHFRADTGQFLDKVNGIKRYLWNTDLVRIPFGLTLNGEAFWKKKLGANRTHLVVTTGKLEFSDFVLAADELVIFRGKNIPEISCIGDMQIDGQIILDVQNGQSRSSAGKGAPGGAASLGGAAGGQGGDSPFVVGGLIHGRNGADVRPPAGHPRAAMSKATGGQGSRANPANGLKKSILWFGSSGFASRMTAAGGAGGSLWSPNGKSFLGWQGTAAPLYGSTGPTFPPHNKGDLGPASVPGKAFPVMPVTTTASSRTLFSIGGSGGGGGGTCPCGSFPSSVQWNPGVGGGAGGGVIHIMAGHQLFAGSKALIQAKGGAGAGRSNSSSVSASGGGGSGGSVLLQSAIAPVFAGAIDVMGGAGGIGAEKTWLEVASYGGFGGAGMIRVESSPAPTTNAYKGFRPSVTSQNVGLLRTLDYAPVTVATSKWYRTNLPIAPTWLGYTLNTKINGKVVTFSDDGKHPKAQQGQAVVFLIQSATLDPKTGKPIGPTSDWHEGTTQTLNADKNKGTSYRFMLRLDQSVPNTTSIEVLDLTIRY